MDYAIRMAPNPPNGGILARQDWEFTPPSTLFYVNLETLDAAEEAIRRTGDQVLVEGMEVPEIGVFSVFRDSGGVVGAVWEDRSEAEPPEGGWPEFTDDPDPGSVVHVELYSGDPDATRTFHETVFGWDFEAVEGGGYTMVRPPTPPNGGVMQGSEEMPAGALPYLLVASAEDTCRAVDASGGDVLREPFEVEGWGTMAVFRAPGDVVHALWESAPTSGEAPSPEDAPGTEAVDR